MFKRTFATHFGTHDADVSAGIDGIDPGDDEKAARDEARVRREFWPKFRGFAARLPFAEDLVAAYFCALDRNTPRNVQVALIGALAYFVLPFDFIPDMLPLIGSQTTRRCWPPPYGWFQRISARNTARRRGA